MSERRGERRFFDERARAEQDSVREAVNGPDLLDRERPE
jgi:hypothetical protein